MMQYIRIIEVHDKAANSYSEWDMWLRWNTDIETQEIKKTRNVLRCKRGRFTRYTYIDKIYMYSYIYDTHEKKVVYRGLFELNKNTK